MLGYALSPDVDIALLCGDCGWLLNAVGETFGNNKARSGLLMGDAINAHRPHVEQENRKATTNILLGCLKNSTNNKEKA